MAAVVLCASVLSQTPPPAAQPDELESAITGLGYRIVAKSAGPACAPVEEREFWTATGFRLGSTVYLLSTDAVMFEEEMDRLAEQLAEFQHLYPRGLLAP